MERLPSSYNEDDISDTEIDEVFSGIVAATAEIPLKPRNYGERILYVGFSSNRDSLIEIGIEDQDGKLVVFHAREATQASTEEYEKQIQNG